MPAIGGYKGRYRSATIEPEDARLAAILGTMTAIARRRAQQRPANPAPDGEQPEPEPASVEQWANRHRKIDGRPFSLDRFPPLRAIYADQHPRICVIKPAQRGVSEWAINYSMFALDRGADEWSNGQKTGLNVGYVFPTEKALSDFSKERVNGLKRESPYLASLFSGSGEFDAVTFKQVRDSYLYLRGTYAEAGLTSFPADVLILDEYDQMPTSAVALARRRLNASVIGREVDISTPTIVGRGIHSLWLQSDRRVWQTRCGHCAEHVEPDFHRDVYADGEPFDVWQFWTETDIRRAAIELRCPSCREPWPDEWRYEQPGRWIAQEPEVDSLRGYWVPWHAFPMTNLRSLAISAISPDPHELTEFYRSDLGKPYSAGTGSITEEMLRRLSAEPVASAGHRRITMGVDVGARFHYRVSGIAPDGPVDVLAMGSCRTWEEVEALRAHFRPQQLVIDALPELHAARTFADTHRRTRIAFYATERAQAGMLIKLNPNEPIANIHRNMAMDRVLGLIRSAKERWPSAILNAPEVIAHMTAPSRTETQNNKGETIVEWVHTTPDHLYHATVYDVIARAMLAIPQEGSGTQVITSSKVKSGWEKRAARPSSGRLSRLR